MKKSLLILLSLVTTVVVYGQQTPEVVFSRFDLKAYSSLVKSDGWSLRSNFTIKTDRPIKYMKAYYLAVNSVGDAVSDKITSAKKFSTKYTGPFKIGRTLKMVVPFAVWHALKNTAYPYKLELEFMDGTQKDIEINKDNIEFYFPCVEYIDVNDLKDVIASSDMPNLEAKQIEMYFPENEYGESEFSEVIECSLTKDVLFQNAKKWAVSTFYDYKEVLQFEEPELGRLIVKGLFKPKTLENVIDKESEEFRFTITFDFKDNKYRYRINGFESHVKAVENYTIVDKLITPKQRVEYILQVLRENTSTSNAKANVQVEFYNMEYDFVVKLIEKMKREILALDDF